PPRAARPPAETAAARAWDAPAPSSRDLPGGAVLGILEHDTHGGEFVADAIGLLEVLRLAGGIAGFDETRNFRVVDGERLRPPRRPFGGRVMQHTNDLPAGFEASGGRLAAFRRLAAQLVQ